MTCRTACLPLCAKGYFGPVGRGSRNAGVPEACFYRDLAHATGVRTLNSVWADVDLSTEHGVVITEDAVEAGAVFCDALDPCTVDRTAETLEQFALLHVHAWEDARLAESSYLTPRLAWILQVRGHQRDPRELRRPQRRRCARRHARRGRPSSTPTGTCRRELRAPVGRSRTATRHVGNTFLDGDGRPGLLDWQVTQYGPWGIDVGYHIASALEPDVRAANERDLLRHYLGALTAAGVTNAPSFDDAWNEYRCGLVHGFFLWGITQYVQPDIIATLLRRLGTAADELDSFAVLTTTT